MSNNKQSSVEWLISQLTEVDYNCINKTFLQSNNSLAGYKMRELFEQAKAMHKEEIKDALIDGSMNSTLIEYRIPQYYNERFGGNNEQQSIPTITLKKIERIDTRDVLYDIKLKQFCVYPKDIDLKTVDIVYIKKNCLKLSIIPNN